MPPSAGRHASPFSMVHKPLPTGFRDPDLTLADVQWVLGHAHITTTEIYTFADMTIKEKALALTAPVTAKPGRYRPTDKTLAFLDSL